MYIRHAEGKMMTFSTLLMNVSRVDVTWAGVKVE